MNKTLYVTDLDGTLLGSDQKVSSYSCSVINDLVAELKILLKNQV